MVDWDQHWRNISAIRAFGKALRMSPAEARCLREIKKGRTREMPNVEKMLQNEWLDIDEKVEAAKPTYVWVVMNVSDLTATNAVGVFDCYAKARDTLDDMVAVLKDVLYHSNVRERPCVSDEYVYYVDGRECRLRIDKKEVL